MYALKLDDCCRILHVTTEAFATEDHIIVEQLPEGDTSEYRYENGEFVFDPQEKTVSEPTRLDTIEAQITYTAMMTDTLLEV